MNSTEIMSTENREKLKNYVTKTEKIPKNDNYVALIVMSSTVTSDGQQGAFLSRGFWAKNSIFRAKGMDMHNY